MKFFEKRRNNLNSILDKWKKKEIVTDVNGLKKDSKLNPKQERETTSKLVKAAAPLTKETRKNGNSFFKTKEVKKPKKEHQDRRHKHKILAELIEKSGFDWEREKIIKVIFRINIILVLCISLGFLFYFSHGHEISLLYVIIAILLIWSLGFVLMLLVIWLIFFAIIDFRIYQRRIGIEEVLPDFLQLTSANIRAGMPIDQALWHAIRPNFGVLAKEMEDVAKRTMSGTDLEEALTKFADKYDSSVLKRSISLLIEGLNAGGEVGELLDRISTNIQESRLMQKEMAASVTTYAIFISFASIVAAPFLLALSSQLLVVIKGIISTINIPTGTKVAISLSKVSVEPADFRIFALTTLSISSVLSAAIVAIIKKGNVRAGLKYIPIFAVSAILIYLLLDYALGFMFAGMF